MEQAIATNKKARHLYEILDTLEAGLVLTGAEIKGIRAHKVSLIGSYARLLYNAQQLPELYWVGGQIVIPEGDTTRSRKLLVHKRELTRFIGKLQEKGLTLIPLRLYLNRGRAKLELGLGRGKKLHDKRETMKRRDIQREVDQAQKSARI
jgi:SsrA-binding protein